MPINKNEITKEMVEKAMQCKTANELIVLAKSYGIDITREEAEEYLAELAEVDLADKELKDVSGGICPAKDLCIPMYTCPKKFYCNGLQ